MSSNEPETKSGLSRWVKRHDLVVYYVLAYAITWAIASPLIASAQGLSFPVPFALHYLTAYGPLIAAIITIGITYRSAGLHELYGRMFKWRVGAAWVLVSTFSLIALFALAAIIIYLTGGDFPDLSLLGVVNYLPNLGLSAWGLWLLTSGFGEETGWRGYALPRLQRSRSTLSASLILGLLWAGWHLPFFLYLETYVKLGLASFPGFAIGVIAGAIVFTWLYNSTVEAS